MTEPLITSGELRPLFNLIFSRRISALILFVAVAALCYCILLVMKIDRYEAGALVMIKIPIVDYEFRVDPNPQVAPAYVDLAISDAMLFDTHTLMAELRKAADTVANEVGIEQDLNIKKRDKVLYHIHMKPEVQGLIDKAAETLTVDWQRELFRQPEFFVGLFEFEQASLSGMPLHAMQESFQVKTNIAQQTNITMVNQPFLNFKVRWSSPGAASVYANLWARLFVEKTNRLAAEMGSSTEEAILMESSKIEAEVAELKKHVSELQSRAEYQKMLEAQSIEDSLYGSRNSLDMFGYVELHANIGFQSGLVGEINKMEVEKSRAEAALAEGGIVAASAESAEIKRLQASLEGARAQLAKMKNRAQAIRAEVAEFITDYKNTEFQLNQRNRIMSERLTAATFSSARLKSGYMTPPVNFGERAVPSRHPTGPSRLALSLVIGFFSSILYLFGVVYKGYLVPLSEMK